MRCHSKINREITINRMRFAKSPIEAREMAVEYFFRQTDRTRSVVMVKAELEDKYKKLCKTVNSLSLPPVQIQALFAACTGGRIDFELAYYKDMHECLAEYGKEMSQQVTADGTLKKSHQTRRRCAWSPSTSPKTGGWAGAIRGGCILKKLF